MSLFKDIKIGLEQAIMYESGGDKAEETLLCDDK